MPQSELNALLKQIKDNATLPGGDAYWQNNEALYGAPHRTTPGMIPLLSPALANADPNPNVDIVTVGDGGPQGFGKGMVWHRQRPDEELAIAIIVNAADPLGVSIGGLLTGDRIRVVPPAFGTATFAKKTGSPLGKSLIGLIAAGADIAAKVFEFPELTPVIQAASDFAEQEFGVADQKNEDDKPRDPYGHDTSSNGGMAREEGGIIVCLPQANAALYSGESEKLWVKKPGPRTPDKYPPHVVGQGYFPRLEADTEGVVTAPGEAIFLAWDWKFTDNVGFYRLNVHIVNQPL